MNLLNLSIPVATAAIGITLLEVSAISFTSMWIENVVDCYKPESITFAALIMMAIAAAAIIISIPQGVRAIGIAIALMIAILTPQTAASAKEKECQLSCSKANGFHFANAIPAAIIDVEQFKIDEGFGPPTSPYDVCACDDGSLVIYSVGRCGRIDWRNFPHVTSHRWK